ncbi:MAG: YigZ family protein [Lachnospiraceae bacterium]|nr:YigZ family protein [Lachnospiraceae bacterium]
MEESKFCIFDRAEDEYDEKRSRFIAEIYPVHDEEEAKEYILATKKKYYDARHHCFAYIIGYNSDFKKASDDGEPSGTAGKPILEILESRGIFNALIIVTRYFGGIKLGTGGLTRAYREASKMVTDKAKLSMVKRGSRFELTVSYSMGGTIENYFRKEDIIIEDIVYGEKQTFRVLVPEEKIERTEADLKNILGTEELPKFSDLLSFCEDGGRVTLV